MVEMIFVMGGFALISAAVMQVTSHFSKSITANQVITNRNYLASMMRRILLSEDALQATLLANKDFGDCVEGKGCKHLPKGAGLTVVAPTVEGGYSGKKVSSPQGVLYGMEGSLCTKASLCHIRIQSWYQVKCPQDKPTCPKAEVVQVLYRIGPNIDAQGKPLKMPGISQILDTRSETLLIPTKTVASTNPPQNTNAEVVVEPGSAQIPSFMNILLNNKSLNIWHGRTDASKAYSFPIDPNIVCNIIVVQMKTQYNSWYQNHYTVPAEMVHDSINHQEQFLFEKSTDILRIRYEDIPISKIIDVSTKDHDDYILRFKGNFPFKILHGGSEVNMSCP